MSVAAAAPQPQRPADPRQHPEPDPRSAQRDQSWRRLPQHRPAVNAYERDRYQQRQAGTWAPFTATAPIREHVDQLRAAGMTSEQIAQISGVSVSTLTRVYRVTRMTAVAADAVLAIPAPQPPPAADVPGPAPGPDTTRQLQALVADGWSLTQLADAAGIHERTAWQTAHGHTTPSPRTVAAVDALYRRLRLEDPGDGYAAVRSRRRAERQGWTPTTGEPAGTLEDLVDQVAVDRVVAGRPAPLRAEEQQAALRRLAGVQSNDEIALRLGVATRTVIRHRTSQGLPAYTPLPPINGPTR